MKRVALPVVLLTVLLAVLLRSAWVCDDAFITLRTIDNLVHGYGLRWNTVERVQTFTHPLWLLVLTPPYAASRAPYAVPIALSLLASLAGAWVLFRRIAGSAAGMLLAAFVLTGSKAFVDYSTSGLENPLTHLLVLAFAALYLRPGEPRLLGMATVAGLATLNRMDTLLLFLPVLAAGLWRRWRAGLRDLAVGFLPFAAWEGFSLVYYGFPFPNTAYAKLATGIPRVELLEQGAHYFLSTIRFDPITALAIIAALVMAAGRGDRERGLAAGVVLYLGYVLWIGGDFMSGRFLSAPLVLAAALLSRWRPRRVVAAAVPLVAALVLGLLPARSPLRAGTDYGRLKEGAIDARGVADERAFYYESTGLLRVLGGSRVTDHHAARDGLDLRRRGPGVYVRGGVGLVGFYAGPAVYLVEPWAITDPLLARLPVSRTQPVRIGHFTRDLPEGYLESLRSGENRIRDPRLAALYEAVTEVTRGSLWRGERLDAAWRLNRGAYRIRPPAGAAVGDARDPGVAGS